MKTLDLVLEGFWFDEIEAGKKSIEYRRLSKRWITRIWDRKKELTHVRFRRGYTKKALVFEIQKIEIGPCPIPHWQGDFLQIHFVKGQPKPSPCPVEKVWWVRVLVDGLPILENSIDGLQMLASFEGKNPEEFEVFGSKFLPIEWDFKPAGKLEIFFFKADPLPIYDE